MTNAFGPNEGDRPSHLTLDRYATGELEGVERQRVEAWLAEHPEGRDYLADVEAARSKVRPFDAAAIRRSALQVEHEAPGIPVPANRPFPLRLVVGLVVALAALLLLVPRLVHGPVDDPETHDVRFRGGETLSLYTVKGSALASPWAGQPLAAGDTVAFRVKPSGHRGVVLLSVDGAGTVTVFYPRPGDDPAPFGADSVDEALPLTVTLDAAPGPEVWVAAFDADPADAQASVAAAWQAGGALAVTEWARAHSADAVTVEKR